MISLNGKYNEATVYTDVVDSATQSQIITLCNQKFTEGSDIKIMSDCHAGAGCVIGTTMTITDKVVPNLVGVDIGCGMTTIDLGDIDIDLEALDNYIRNNIPHGFNINQKAQINYVDKINKLYCLDSLSKGAEMFNRALGSLGGGNHFIEVNRGSEGNVYLVIHSGSRNLGHQVATYYQNLAISYHRVEKLEEYTRQVEVMIRELKKHGKMHLIQDNVKKLKEAILGAPIVDSLCYLEGELMENYLHDLNIVQKYAEVNRDIMAERIICEHLRIENDGIFAMHTIHNYIADGMLRKGAISAKKGEKVLIPMNMRDGSILAVGKGNPDWNYSAPHGAGRLMGRGQAKRTMNMEDYKKSMEGIYSTSVKESTIDEAPMVYKPMQSIIDNTKDTIDIVDILKPIYNFKS